MEPLNPIPQCIDCLLTLAKNTALLATDDNPGLVEKSERAARQILADADVNPTSSPEIANRIIREVRRLTGVSDPYIEFKAREMEQARKLFSQLSANVGETLRSRVSLATLGNTLDFFISPEQALAGIPPQFLNEIPFFRDDIDQLEAWLRKTPGLVLYLTDNAGEIYFDGPLYEYIRERSRKIILVVKGGPSLNDLTRAELKTAGLEKMFDPVMDTGTDGAGIDWENASRDFLDLMACADLVISKGMANFETLYPRDMVAPVFFLFKVKCVPIQNYIQAPANSFLALCKKGI
jgi:damage-control phosphatase, subfamily I